jgi:hypothetical protein
MDGISGAITTGGSRSAAARAASRLVQVAAAQRVRLGLTGMAAVFLLVLIAAAGLKPAQPRFADAAHGESLAVLGVAPGAGGPPTAPQK